MEAIWAILVNNFLQPLQEFRRSRRLEIIARKLDRAAESDRRRRSLDRFLAEPRRPVDPEWLRAFLERPR